MDNFSIRNKMKLERESLDKIEYQRLSLLITKHVLNSIDYKKAKTIGIYASMANEVDTYQIIKQALNDGKIVCLPKVVKHDLIFYRINSINDLKKGYFNVMEPTTEIVVSEMDCIFIPLLAFNKNNYRIGYGKGYYDRYLMDKNMSKIGLAFSFQYNEDIATHELDIPMDEMITELGIHKMYSI